MCILSVYTLLKVVGYYDLSVQPMSVRVSKVWMGWVGGVSSIQVFCVDFLNFFNFVKPLTMASVVTRTSTRLFKQF